MKVLIALAMLLASTSVYAAEPPAETAPTEKGAIEKAKDNVNEAAEKASDNVNKLLGDTRKHREESKAYALFNYSPLDLIVPSKIGGTLGTISSGGKTWELEYLRGSISVPVVISDLGKMTDQRLSLIGRSYAARNSFNVSYGLSYFSFAVHIGDEMLSRVTGGSVPNIDMLRLESIGFNLAVGNRWIFDHGITFGIDWVSWAQPVVTTKKYAPFLDYATDAKDREDIDKSVKLLSYFPRLAFLKLQFGVTF